MRAGNWLTACLAALSVLNSSAAPLAEVTFDSDFPGGNVRILKFDEPSGTVELECDYRDSMTDWFWTNFRVRGAAGRHLDFRFRPDRPTKRPRVSRLGMAFSLDEGRTWRWTNPDGNADAFGFSFDFPPDGKSVRFATSFPYVRRDLDAFCAAHPAIRRSTLTQSRKGRDVPLLTVGSDNARIAFIFTARHHASEVPANWVMEGMAEAAAADTVEGRWIRENARCLFVPFMDTDGCEDGDPGKNRKPHDHNRDYEAELYPEVRAFKALVRDEAARRKLVYFDMHAPQVRGSEKKPRHDNAFTMGPPPPMDARWNDYRRRLVEATKGNALKFLGEWDEPWMTDFNVPAKLPGEQKSTSWVLTQTNVEWATTFEFGYGLCGGVSSPEGLRELGRAMMNALVQMRFPHILVRDFRTVKDGRVISFNIGTAVHCPGTLAVLEKHLPGVKLSVWADAPLVPELQRIMDRRFPQVKIHTGREVPETDADLFLVSSGNGIAKSVQKSIGPWREKTGRPVAAYAVGSAPKPLAETFAFCFYRDRTGFAKAVARKATPAVTGFAPDAVFDFDAADTAGADAFLKACGLETGKFVCAIPGERATASWNYFGRKPNEKRAALNAEHELGDNAIVCAAIVEAVRKHHMKALLCAEQRSEMPLITRALLAQLPDDVKASCVCLKDFWAPDLALGVYRRSRCVFGIEMHSQVMAIGNGVPAVVMCHSGFGTKSDMLKDIGLGEWLMDIDEPNAAARAVQIVGGILADENAAREKLRAARRNIDAAAADALAKAFP